MDPSELILESVLKVEEWFTPYIKTNPILPPDKKVLCSNFTK